MGEKASREVKTVTTDPFLIRCARMEVSSATMRVMAIEARHGGSSYSRVAARQRARRNFNLQ